MLKSKSNFIRLFITTLFLFICVQSSLAVTLPLRLSWDSNTESDLAYYRVYYGNASRNYINYITVDKQYPSCTLNENNLIVGQTYYISLTAIDYSLNESGYSDELLVFIELPPTNTTTTTVSSFIVIEAEGMSYHTNGKQEGEYWNLWANGTMNEEVYFSTTDNYRFEIIAKGRLAYDIGPEMELLIDGEIKDKVFVNTTTPETFVFNLEISEGSHEFAIGFYNDYYNPSAGIDRNLYVDKTTITLIQENITTTTTTITTSYQGYCSTDPTLVLHSSIPEEGTMSVTLPVNLENATSASLFLTLWDPDIFGEGYIYVNDNNPVDLPVGNYDNQVHSFEVLINVDWLVQGENYFRFTHVATMGYEVRKLCVEIKYATSPTTSVPPSPGVTTIPATLTTTIPPIVTSTTTSITSDETPPTGTVVINNDDEITNAQLVTLSLSAEDDISGMGEGAQMSISNDNTQWSPPEPFASTKEWVLSTGEGKKTVYIKFCDAAGNWMLEPVSDTITLEASATCLKPVQLDITAIGSSGDFLPFWSKEKAVDGNTDTGWLSTLRLLFMKEEHLTVDLGETKIVNRMDIFSKPFLFFDLFPLDFQVQVSTANEEWAVAFSENDYSSPVSHSDSWYFNETKARYLRIDITKTKPFLFFFYLTYIAEIKIHGCTETDTLSLLIPFDRTKSRGVKLTPPTETSDKKKPSPPNVPPGIPGKPFFVLDNHP